MSEVGRRGELERKRVSSARSTPQLRALPDRIIRAGQCSDVSLAHWTSLCAAQGTEPPSTSAAYQRGE